MTYEQFLLAWWALVGAIAFAYLAGVLVIHARRARRIDREIRTIRTLLAQRESEGGKA